MKIPIILLVLAVFFGSFFITDSNAILGPGAPQEDPSLPEISVQIQVRNSDGVLVAYTEPSIYYLNNIFMIHQYLDKQPNKKIITIDGKNYEQIELEFTFTERGNGQRASISLFEDGIAVLTTRFNGFLAEPGDIQIFSLKIIRTI